MNIWRKEQNDWLSVFIIVGIFQSDPKWWTEQTTNQPTDRPEHCCSLATNVIVWDFSRKFPVWNSLFVFPVTVSGLWWRDSSTSSDFVQKKVQLEASVLLQLNSLSNRDTVIGLILYFFHRNHSRKKSPEFQVQREGTITVTIDCTRRVVWSLVELCAGSVVKPVVSCQSTCATFSFHPGFFSVVLSIQSLNPLL